MLRLLFSAISLTGVPVLFALWPLGSSPVTGYAPVHAAVWRLEDRRDAEMEALKGRIQTLQARVDLTNARLSAAVAALEADGR